MHHGQKFVAGFVTGILLAFATVATSTAQRYPSKPIRIVVGGTPGSGPDMLARLMGTKMHDNWGQPVVIDNRLPAVVAAHLVAKAAPDGYTLLLVPPGLAIRAAMLGNLPYDTLRDFAGVTEIGYSNTLVVVAPSLGVKSVKELAAYAQAHPGKVFFATPPAGGVDHLNAERFRIAAGIKAQHVSYKGTVESLIEVAAGRAQFTTTGLTGALPFIKDGKLQALLQRIPMLPGVPLAADVLPAWTQMGATAVLAPAGMPLAIRQQLGTEIARVLQLPDVRIRLEAMAWHVNLTTPEEQERRLRTDIAMFAKLLKEIGLRPG